MNTHFFTVIAASASIAVLSLAPTAASAAVDPAPHCATMVAHVDAMAPTPAISPSGNVDRDAAKAMMSLDKTSASVAALEAQCGKNSGERAMARRSVKEMKQNISVLNPFVQLSI